MMPRKLSMGASVQSHFLIEIVIFSRCIVIFVSWGWIHLLITSRVVGLYINKQSVYYLSKIETPLSRLFLGNSQNMKGFSKFCFVPFTL